MIETALRLIVLMIGSFCIFAGIGFIILNTWFSLVFSVVFWLMGWYLIQVSIHCTWNIKKILKKL